MESVACKDKTEQQQILPPPPPPPLLSLKLPQPTIAEHSYSLHYEKKHQAMINGEAEFSTHKEEVQAKLKTQLEKSDQSAHESQSTGQKNLRNLEICSKCTKCGHWIEKDEFMTHMSFHAAHIIDRLLLGDKHSSMSRKELFERNQVTHILNAAFELKNHFEGDGIVYLHLDLEDQVGEQVIPEATRGAEFIDKSLKEGGVVFVHCAMGKSRSVAAIIMYLMLYRNMDYDASLQLIRVNRPLAKPNISYQEQLRSFWRKRTGNE